MQMASSGVRTNDGVLLTKLNSVEKIIESYPLQKFLGKAIYEYNFSCFVVPFVLEPATIIGPKILGVGVRNRKLSFKESMTIWGASPEGMDLGRS